MFRVGLFEIFVIFLILLLFFRPEEIFSLFRQAGAWYHKIRNFEKQIKENWDGGTTVPDKEVQKEDLHP